MRKTLLPVLLTLLAMPAAPARAADWAPPEVLVSSPTAHPRDGVVAGDGTLMFASQDATGLVVTRRTPGQPAQTSTLPNPRDYEYAASPNGTVALLAITDRPEGGLQGRVYSWAPGADAPMVTGPYTAGDTNYAITFFDDTHVGIIEGGYGEAARQITGELGGTLTPAPLVRADGQPMPVTAPVVASRAGRPPVVFFGTFFQGRLLMARASGTSFGPVALLATYAAPGSEFPPNVYSVQPSIGTGGSLTVAFATASSAGDDPRSIFHSVRAARVTDANTLADERVLDSTTMVFSGSGQSGDFLDLRGNATGPGGSQTVLWDREHHTSQSNSTLRTLAARRAATAAEFGTAQPLGPDRQVFGTEGVTYGMGVFAHPGGVSVARYDDSQEEAAATVTAFRAIGDGPFGDGQTVLEAPYVSGGGPRNGGYAQGKDTALVALRDSDGTLRARQFDIAPPLVAIDSVTADGERAFKLAATASDKLSGPPKITWSFGDGAEATGAQVRHQYAAAGTYTVTVTATDGAGEQSTATRVVEVAAPAPVTPVTPTTPVTPADTTAPLLSAVKASPSRVRRGRSVTLRFTTSEAALVAVKITRRGRKPRTISASFAAGAGKLKLSTKKLPLGKLRLSVVATDAAGNKSAAVVRRLVVRRR